MASMACGTRRPPTADRVPHRPGRRRGGADPVVVGVGDARLRPRPTPARWRSGRRRGRRRGPRPHLGAAIVEGLGWRWRSSSTSPSASTPWLAGRRTCTSHPTRDTQVPSPVGVVLIAGAAGLLSYGHRSAPKTSDGSAPEPSPCSSPGWSCSRCSSSSAAHQAPTLDLDLFRIPTSGGQRRHAGFGTAFAALFSVRSSSSPMSGDWSVLQAGFGVAPGPSSSASSHLWPQARRHDRQRPLLITGGVLYAAAACSASRCSTPTSTTCLDFLPSMVLSGLGVGLVFPSSPASWPRPCHRAAPASAAPRPSGSPVRRHLRCRPHHRLPGTSGAIVVGFDRDLVDRRHRWTCDVCSRASDAHLHAHHGRAQNQCAASSSLT